MNNKLLEKEREKEEKRLQKEKEKEEKKLQKEKEKEIKAPKISKPKTQTIHVVSKKPKKPKIKNPRKQIPKKPKIQKKRAVQITTIAVTPSKIPKIRKEDNPDVFAYLTDGIIVKKNGTVWKNDRNIARFGTPAMAVVAVTAKQSQLPTKK